MACECEATVCRLVIRRWWAFALVDLVVVVVVVANRVIEQGRDGYECDVALLCRW